MSIPDAKPLGTRVIKVEPDYTAFADAGIDYEGSHTWEGSWTWGGNEIRRNLDKPNMK